MKENILHTSDAVIENHKNFKILLVEDNVTNQKLATIILNNAGFACDIASNGAEAIKAFKDKTYDLILMDCQMPILDGYEATKEIRYLEGEIKHIPIIALTAHALEGDIEKCLSCGMNDYVCKPIDNKKFISTVKKYLPNQTILNEDERSYVLINSILSEIVKNTSLSFEQAKEIFNEYLVELPSMVEVILKAISEENFKLIASQAHLIKGSSANLRIHELNKLSLELENVAKLNDISLCNILLKEIQKYFSLLKN